MSDSKKNFHTLLGVFFKKVVPWTAFFIVFYAAALFVIGQTPWLADAAHIKNPTGKSAYTLTRFREINNVKDVDILFVGSSHSYRSFDSNILSEHGLKTFNMGSGYQTPFNSYYLLKHYIDSVKPKTIVLETFWEMLGDNSSESTLDLASNTPISKDMIEMSSHSDSPVVINSVLSNYLGRLVKPLDSYEQQERAGDDYSADGYVKSKAVKNVAKKIANLKPGNFYVSQKQIDYVGKIIELAKDKGVNIILVRTPVTPQKYESVLNYEDTARPFQDYADKYGIPFVDFNDPGYTNRLDLRVPGDFTNPDHLNSSGASKFTKVFLEVFKTQVERS